MAPTTRLFFKPNSSTRAFTTKLSRKSDSAIRMAIALKLSQKPNICQKPIDIDLINFPN